MRLPIIDSQAIALGLTEELGDALPRQRVAV